MNFAFLFCGLGLILSLNGLIVHAAYEDIIMKPVAGKSGDDIALIFAQGASIKTSQYESLMTAFQNAVPFPLWVAIPQCYSDICVIPGTLSAAVSRGLQGLQAAGMKNGTKLFYAGHSLGGSQIPGVVKSTPEFLENAVGMVLMGSFLTRDFKTGKTPEGRPQVEFPIPTLTIGGELDGLCRITRMAEALYSQITFSENPASAKQKLPVTIVEGMTHMQFASGTPPPLVKASDLTPEITEEAAHAAAASDAAAFMTATLGLASFSALEGRVEASTSFVAPLVDALLMESYQNFLPPCYCETKDEYGGLEYGTCVTQPNCQGNIPWTEQVAQPLVAGVGVLDGLSVEVTDSIHKVTEESPSCHLPHIHKSQYKANSDPNANPGNGASPSLCDKGQQCTLTITTVTENLYNSSVNASSALLAAAEALDASAVLGAGLDTGFSPLAATELRAKMKSRQAVWEASGIANVNYTVSDEIIANGGSEDLCRPILQAAVDWAKKRAGSKTLARYLKSGQQIEIGPDLGTCAAGPCWIYTPLSWVSNNTGAGKVTVQSIAFGSQNKNDFPCGENKPFTLPCDAGFHYCKLLSPARVMEWMYLDGLRLHNHL